MTIYNTLLAAGLLTAAVTDAASCPRNKCPTTTCLDTATISYGSCPAGKTEDWGDLNAETFSYDSCTCVEAEAEEEEATVWMGTKTLGQTCDREVYNQTASCVLALNCETPYDSTATVCQPYSLRSDGSYCDSAVQCKHNTCTSNRCTGGLAAGVNCASGEGSCGIGLECSDKNTKCRVRLELAPGADCDAAERGDCLDGVCIDAKCVAYGSVANGEAADSFNMCKSLYLEEGKCKAPVWDNYGEACDEDSECKFPQGECRCQLGDKDGNKEICMTDKRFYDQRNAADAGLSLFLARDKSKRAIKKLCAEDDLDYDEDTFWGCRFQEPTLQKVAFDELVQYLEGTFENTEPLRGTRPDCRPSPTASPLLDRAKAERKKYFSAGAQVLPALATGLMLALSLAF